MSVYKERGAGGWYRTKKMRLIQRIKHPRRWSRKLKKDQVLRGITQGPENCSQGSGISGEGGPLEV